MVPLPQQMASTACGSAISASSDSSLTSHMRAVPILLPTSRIRSEPLPHATPVTRAKHEMVAISSATSLSGHTLTVPSTEPEATREPPEDTCSARTALLPCPVKLCVLTTAACGTAGGSSADSEDCRCLPRNTFSWLDLRASCPAAAAGVTSSEGAARVGGGEGVFRSGGLSCSCCWACCCCCCCCCCSRAGEALRSVGMAATRAACVAGASAAASWRSCSKMPSCCSRRATWARSCSTSFSTVVRTTRSTLKRRALGSGASWRTVVRKLVSEQETVSAHCFVKYTSKSGCLCGAA
mmetsp:Transcript_10172/g.41391  ORF Transcript_10172/g.41391 Transcript_10172/m.41391 type:complete len:296 (+) Transcript_10172:2000-2887(+)